MVSKQCTPSNSGANLILLFCCCNGLLMFTGDDFDDDVEDLSSLPSDISLFFMDSTCGWLFPSLEALDENPSFCPSDSAHRASNELNIYSIVIETWIEEVGCVYFLSYMLQQLCKQLKIVFWGSKQACFWGFKKRDFLLGFLKEKDFLLGFDTWERERGERRGI